MAKGVLIEVRGLKDLHKQVGKLADNVIAEVDNKMALAANKYVNLAQNDAPVDEGNLRKFISAKKNRVMDYEVVSPADYSAYLEWGTKTKVDVPADLTEYAAKFKGKGGGKGLFEKIFDWVKRKGIGSTMTKSGKRSKSKKALAEEYKVARAIYYHILKYGIKPQPFFFKHRKEVYAQLQKDLGPAIKQALKK